LEADIKYQARLPLVTISKYEDPSIMETVTPTINVTMTPVSRPGSSKKMLQSVVDQSLSRLDGFEELEKVQTLKVSGLDAAFVKAKFQMSNDVGETYDIMTTVCIAPRGKFVFTIGMSGPLDGPDFSQVEFDEVFSSVKFDE